MFALCARQVEQRQRAVGRHCAGCYRAAVAPAKLAGLGRGVEEFAVGGEGQVRRVFNIRGIDDLQRTRLIVHERAEDAAVFALGIGADIGHDFCHSGVPPYAVAWVFLHLLYSICRGKFN